MREQRERGGRRGVSSRECGKERGEVCQSDLHSNDHCEYVHVDLPIRIHQVKEGN